MMFADGTAPLTTPWFWKVTERVTNSVVFPWNTKCHPYHPAWPSGGVGQLPTLP